MSEYDHEQCDAAADERLLTMAEAFGSDPDDDAAMWRLWLARRRLSEFAAAQIMARPDLRAQIPRSGYIADDIGTAAETVLYVLCVRFERIGELIEAYVGDERLATWPIASLLGDASRN
jgi:hypothetical protein